MKIKHQMLKILEDVAKGTKAPIIAQAELLDLFGVSYSSILHGGDALPDYRLKDLEDCQLIKKVLRDKGFINAGLVDAMCLWSEYSDSYAAGWLGLPDNDEEIYECIQPYIRTVHNIVLD